MKLIKKEFYPVSSRIGIKLGIDKNSVSLFDPENPTVNKTEIRLFVDKFFKSDWIKNLKDDLFFKKIKVDMIDTTNSLAGFVERKVHSVAEDGELTTEETDCFIAGCSRSYSQKLMEEYTRLLFPFLNIEVRKQNDLLYKNSLDKIDEEALRFYLQGIDDFEVILVVDTLHKNYVNLNDVKVYEDYQLSNATAYDVIDTAYGKVVESQKFVAPAGKHLIGQPDFIGGEVTYLLNVKMYGNLTTYKGKIKTK